MKRFVIVVFMLIGSTALAVYLAMKPGCACLDIFPARIYKLNALDPLRDRAPELTAQKFLHDQGQGKCQPADSRLCQYALNSHPVLDWRLAAREDSRSHAVLYYHVKARESDRPGEFWGQAAVELERTVDVWRVKSYDAAY